MNSEEIGADFGLGWEGGRAATTARMMQITAAAKRLNLNRRLDVHAPEGPPLLHRLDPDGLHVLVPIFVHRHAQEQEVEPHVRTQGYLRLKGGVVTRPHPRVVDVPFDLFRLLPTIDSVYETLPGARERTERTERWHDERARAWQRLGRSPR